ncbi:hypothetical protein EC991_007176 [Linnemannia zychae]|nr:hypothetical protein EC991_007176 [Linnemannia zychae]
MNQAVHMIQITRHLQTIDAFEDEERGYISKLQHYSVDRNDRSQSTFNGGFDMQDERTRLHSVRLQIYHHTMTLLEVLDGLSKQDPTLVQKYLILMTNNMRKRVNQMLEEVAVYKKLGHAEVGMNSVHVKDNCRLVSKIKESFGPFEDVSDWQ